MAQLRKISQETEIRSSGDKHFELFKYKPHEISKMSPRLVKSCELVEGEWGTVGSVVKWTYNQGGKEMTSKEIVSAIDNQKKLVTYKVIEGDLMMLYNSFEFTVKINKNGTKESVSYTLEYEKTSEVVEDPNELMDAIITMTKDIEIYHLNN